MGQQQLLLLVLGAIIVGLAVIFGITLYNRSATNANIDAIYQDLYAMASRIEVWYQTPMLLGGGGRPDNLQELQSFRQIGYYDLQNDSTGLEGAASYSNDNGIYNLMEGEQVSIEAVPAEDKSLKFRLIISVSNQGKYLDSRIETE